MSEIDEILNEVKEIKQLLFQMLQNQNNTSLRLITAAEAKGVEILPAASVKRKNLKKGRIEQIRNKYMMQKHKKNPNMKEK